MTQEELVTWKSANSAELRKLLKNPVLESALTIVAGMTMAQSMTGPRLLQHARNSATFFGVDVGRACLLQDLYDLAIEQKPAQQLERSYGAKSNQPHEPIVIPPKKKK